MNILYVNHTIRRSGAAISLGTLIRHLSKAIHPHYLLRKGSEVDEVLAVGSRPAVHARFLSQFMTTLYGQGLPRHQFLWQLVKVPWVILRILRLCRRWAIDLVHVNETTLLADVLGAHLAGRPVLVHARTACLLRPFERFCLEWIGALSRVRFVAIDEEVRQSLPPICRAKCSVVHNPISLGPEPGPETLATLRRDWGVPEGALIIGQAASLHSVKGIWQVLELAERLCPRHPNLCFVLAGDTGADAGQGPEVRKSIERRGLQGRVLLPGYQSDLAATYGGFDIALCLFGGGLGGVGRAAYEAALSGTPLLATLPDPGGSQTLQHGVSGLLHTQEDLDGMEVSLDRLIGDASLRDSLGASAHEAIAARHDPGTVAQKIETLYREMTIA